MINADKLRAGDKIRRIEPPGTAVRFTVGKEYEVYHDGYDTYVREDNGEKYSSYMLAGNKSKWELVEEEVEEVGRVQVGDIGVSFEGSVDARYTLEVETDYAGFIAIKKLEEKYRNTAAKAREKERIKAQIAELEKKLKEL